MPPFSEDTLIHDVFCRSIANFTRHPGSVTASGKVKLVRYQENPTSYWGPGKKSTHNKVDLKRKRKDEGVGDENSS